ncbi:MAG: 4Fe-4S dicluster domain-containing protein [Verrucomicrobiota bacterium]|nr:4Fe-4S dicluster domain-containing protein [Verrucomicrobiota bacterium]
MSDNGNTSGGGTLPRPVIDADECKSCGRCVEACPKKCLRLAAGLNSRGVKPAEYAGAGCIGCAICFYTCPEPYAITIQKP